MLSHYFQAARKIPFVFGSISHFSTSVWVCRVCLKMGYPQQLLMTHHFPSKNWHTVVSINGGTPKSSILIGFSLINHPAVGVPPMERLTYVKIKWLIPFSVSHSPTLRPGGLLQPWSSLASGGGWGWLTGYLTVKNGHWANKKVDFTKVCGFYEQECGFTIKSCGDVVEKRLLISCDIGVLLTCLIIGDYEPTHRAKGYLLTNQFFMGWDRGIHMVHLGLLESAQKTSLWCV